MSAKRREPARPEAEPTLPAVYVQFLSELAERWHVELQDLVDGLDVDRATLGDPGARLPLSTVEALIERARALTREPGLGFYLGLKMRISAHGYLGFAAMSAGTLREAIELAARYAPTRTTALALRLHEAGGSASLVIEERTPLGRARDVLIFGLAVGLWQLGCALTGRPLTGGLDVAFPEPDYFQRFAHATPGPVRFGQPLHQLLIDPGVLDLPLTMADPVALRLARESCERELDALGSREQLVERTRALLADPLPTSGVPDHLASQPISFRTIEQVAKRLHVSVRTLKRRLAEEGTTYSELVDAERRERALLLLRSDDLTLAEIADRLGYSDAANFTRAFRRWTGVSPRAFRRSGS
jgi:AraC-like DNA-binding protein